MSVIEAERGVPILLQTAATTGAGIVIAIPTGFTQHRIYIRGNATISAGAVQPESASDPSYTGTWAAHGSPITVVDVSELTLAISGLLAFFRVRISTNVTGGTVTVTYFGY